MRISSSRRLSSLRDSDADKKGFSIVEIVISVAFLAILGASAVFLLRNQLVGTLDAEAQAIKTRLLQAEAEAIAGNSGSSWGMHFDNITISAAYYALFSGPAYGASNATTTYYISKLVEFQTPAAGTSTDIVFNKLTGTVSSSTTIVIRLKSDNTQTKTISIRTQGAVSVQ